MAKDLRAWKAIGAAIKSAREPAGQNVIEKRMKVRQATVSDWESGKSRLDPEQLRDLERLFKLPLGHFLRVGGFVADSGEWSTEETITADPNLTPERREILRATYRDFVRQTRLERRT